jgi:prophage maintenance system killer protein
MENTPGGEVLVYKTADGRAQVEVRLDQETVWLTQDQMSALFGRERSVITKHIRNVFREGELESGAVCANFAHTANDGKTYQVDHYNLDVIISIGYRVKSKQGTQFRQWATGILRDYLIKGYALNQTRLSKQTLEEAQQTIDLLSRTLTANTLLTDKGRAVLDVVNRYTKAWRLLLEFDEGRLSTEPRRPIAPSGSLSINDARRSVVEFRNGLAKTGESGPLFGQERGDAMERIMGSLEQTFGGKPLYPSAQARIAHLLYFVIKDHPFSDGNKRIGSFLFLDNLQRNGLFLGPDGHPRISGNAMVALALLIAESSPKQKEMMIRLVLNLLDDEGT